MAAPTSTNEVTARKLSASISALWAKIKSTFQTLGNLVTAWGSTPSDTKYPSEKLVKNYVDNKSWFKNVAPESLQNSNAYYQCIAASTNDFSGLVKLYDVTEFFNGTIVNKSEHSVFFGDVSLIRDGGNAGCKYARVCAMIGYNNDDSNIILQSDDDNAYPVLVKEDFERLNVAGSLGAYVISNGVVSLDTTRTKSRYFVVDCSTYSRMFINAGFYSPSSSSLNDVKAYIFANDSGTVLGNSESTNFDGYVDVPAGATKLYLHTNYGYSQVSVGPTTTSPKYFLAMRYVAGWPAGTIEYFGRFYTRVTASPTYSARPLLLTYVQNFAPTGRTYIPSGYVVQKTATYTTHSAVSDKLSTARKLSVSLSNTSTDTSFDGSADVTNIKTIGTLGVGNGGTGATTKKAAEYAINGGMAQGSGEPQDSYQFVFSRVGSDQSATNGVFLYRTAATIWSWIKGKISSVLGLSESNGVKTFTGNAATATTAQNYNTSTGTIKTALAGKSDTSHTHGNITNAGGITASGVTIANGDSLVIVDSSETNKLVAKTSVTFDGSTTTKALSQKGTFETFLTSHQSITGKLNTDGSNVAETWSHENINKVLKNITAGVDDVYNGDDFIASSHTDAGEKENKFTRRPSSKVLNWLFNNGQYSAQIGGDMKKFGWVMGDYVGNTAIGGWHIAKTDISNSSGYGNCVFKALVVIDKFAERVTYNETGYNANNFVGILDIYARMNSSTVAVSNIKKIGRLTSFYPNATSSGSTGWAVFAKVNQSNFTIDWYIGRGGQSSLSVQDIFKYTKISIMPLQNNGSITLYMDRVTSTINCGTAPDDYWQMFKTPLIAASAFGKGSSSLPVYITADANTFATVDAASTQGNFIRSLSAATNIGASEYIAAAGASSGQWKYTFSTLLDWINSKNVMERSPASVGTSHKRIQLGYGGYTNDNVGYCCYLVHIFFNYVDDNLVGKGVTVLVNYDWRKTAYQSAKCQILNDNGLSAAGYNVVLANFKTDNNTNLHITLGLVKNTAPTTLVGFSHSYCKIMRIAYGGDWTESVTSDNVGTYDYLIPAVFGKADSFSTSVNAGSANQPVYFNNGVPTVCNWWVS